MSMCAHGRPAGTNSRRNSAGDEHAAPAVAGDVGEVGHAGVELGAEVLGQRHRPGVLADLPAERGDPVAELLGAHHARRAQAERDLLGAGEGGRLDQVVGGVLGRPDDRVGQDQPALGVGVEHLDGLAAVHPQHVAGPVGGAPDGMFSAIGTVAVTATGSSSRAASTVVAITAAAPPMSRRHVVHVRRRA